MLDIHTHTVNSDGEKTVKELLETAGSMGLKYLAITDHDTVNAYDDLKEINISQYYSGKIIPGVELEFVYNGRIMEVLGYNIDIEKIKETKPIITEANRDVMSESKQWLKRLLSVCDRLGFKYSPNLEIKAKNDMPNDIVINDLMSYPENKEKLGSIEMLESDMYYRTTFYRKHICNPESPFYTDRIAGAMNIYDVVEAIHYAGGQVVLAHAFVYGFENTEELIEEIVGLGIIDGIECGHRKHSEEQRIYLTKFAEEHGLLKTAGSDFHRDADCLGYVSYKQTRITEDMISKAILNNQ